MRKLHELTWMLAATLVCGASVFTSCSSDSDDNPVINPDEPQQQLADYTIIFYGHGGSNLDALWITSPSSSKPTPTTGAT